MTDQFPKFYVSRVQKEIKNHEPVYYKVTGRDPEGYVFWRTEGHERSKEGTFYDLFLEEKDGYGVEHIDKSETPWAE